MLGSLVIVVLGVKVVTVRYVRMVRGFHVIAGFVMLGGLIVMLRSVPAVFCRVPVVLGGFLVIGHGVSPFFAYRTKNVRCTGRSPCGASALRPCTTALTHNLSASSRRTDCPRDLRRRPMFPSSLVAAAA